MNETSADNSGSVSRKTALDREVISHFDELNDEPAPAFQQMWQRAQSQAGSVSGDQRDQQKRYWAPLAVAATAMLFAFLVMTSTSVEDEPPALVHEIDRGIDRETDKDAVFKELMATTSWRAPSDELLNGYAALQVGNVPQFDWLDNFDSEKS